MGFEKSWLTFKVGKKGLILKGTEFQDFLTLKNAPKLIKICMHLMSPMLLKTLFLGNQAALCDVYFGCSKMSIHPGWCGSVDWVLACESKGWQFDSQSGHMPGWQARSPVGGVQEATNRCISLAHRCFSPSLSPSLPLSLKIHKENL